MRINEHDVPEAMSGFINNGQTFCVPDVRDVLNPWVFTWDDFNDEQQALFQLKLCHANLKNARIHAKALAVND